VKTLANFASTLSALPHQQVGTWFSTANDAKAREIHEVFIFQSCMRHVKHLESWRTALHPLVSWFECQEGA